MRSIPASAFPGGDADLRHPSWCDLSQCTAADRIAERGVTPLLWEADHHISAPVGLPTVGLDQPVWTAALWSGSDEPIEVAQPWVRLIARHRLSADVVQHDLELDQVGALAVGLAQMYAAATGGGER